MNNTVSIDFNNSIKELNKNNNNITLFKVFNKQFTSLYDDVKILIKQLV